MGLCPPFGTDGDECPVLLNLLEETAERIIRDAISSFLHLNFLCYNEKRQQNFGNYAERLAVLSFFLVSANIITTCLYLADRYYLLRVSDHHRRASLVLRWQIVVIQGYLQHH